MDVDQCTNSNTADTPREADSTMQLMLVIRSIADGVGLSVMLIVSWQILPLCMLAKQSMVVAYARSIEMR